MYWLWWGRRETLKHECKKLLYVVTSKEGTLLNLSKPKSTYTGLQNDTLTSLLSLMVWLHDPCKEKCL